MKTELLKNSVSRSRLKETSRVLEASRAELLDQFAASREIMVEKPADEMEEAQLHAGRDLMVRNLDNGTRCLHDINAALRRIEEGTYGICMHCNEKIGERRLAAVPWTPLCLSCQQAMEQQNDVTADVLAGHWISSIYRGRPGVQA